MRPSLVVASLSASLLSACSPAPAAGHRGVPSISGAIDAASDAGVGTDADTTDAPSIDVDGAFAPVDEGPDGGADGAAPDIDASTGPADARGQADVRAIDAPTGLGDAGAQTDVQGIDASTGPADAGAQADAEVDARGFTGPARPLPLCNPSATWSAGARIDISTSLDDAIAGVTPDQLSIAWTTGTGPAQTIYYADRAKSTDPFGAPQTLSAGAFASDRAALSPDGLRLVVVNADRQGFSELSRVAPNFAFGPPTVGAYTNLNAPGVLSAGETYGDPVLSGDDSALVYSVFGANRTETIFFTARVIVVDDAWPVGFAIAPAAELAAQGSMRRRPTAISLDQQTLFFWDEVKGLERAAWMNDATGVFDGFVDLGARAGACPDATCRSLYYSAPGASSIDLFVASN